MGQAAEPTVDFLQRNFALITRKKIWIKGNNKTNCGKSRFAFFKTLSPTLSEREKGTKAAIYNFVEYSCRFPINPAYGGSLRLSPAEGGAGLTV
jgi:hypothetical protein